MGTRSQAKHSGLKWGSEVAGNGDEKAEDSQKQHCADNDLDMSPIACAPHPKAAAVLPTTLVPSKTRELRKTTVQRSKVKSPTNRLKVMKAPVSNMSGKEENSEILDGDLPVKKKSRTPRTRMEELVQQV